MKKIMILISLCALFVLTSCNITLTKHEVKITGDVITKEYKDIKGTILKIKDVYLKNDNSIKTTLNIIPSEKELITITAQERLFDYVNVTSDNDKIEIIGGKTEKYATNEVTINVYGYNLESYFLYYINAIINVEEDIETLTIDMHDASNVAILGNGKINSLDATLSGASTIEGNNAKMENFKLVLSEASNGVFKDVEGGTMNVTLLGASRLEVTGKAERLSANLSGASKLMDHLFIINEAKVDASGASYLEITVNNKLSVELSGSSNMYYSGNPTIENKKLSGGSKLTRN